MCWWSDVVVLEYCLLVVDLWRHRERELPALRNCLLVHFGEVFAEFYLTSSNPSSSQPPNPVNLLTLLVVLRCECCMQTVAHFVYFLNYSFYFILCFFCFHFFCGPGASFEFLFGDPGALLWPSGSLDTMYYLRKEHYIQKIVQQVIVKM